MAELTGKAISELPAATTIGNSDLLALSQNGASKKITPPVLLSVVESKISGLNSSLATYVRPNLLDNWYFVRGSGSVGAYGSFPVNQRGQASYSAAGFTIDRLNKASGKGTVYTTAQGLQFSTSDDNYDYFNFFGQDVPSWMTMTCSILTNLGITTVKTGSSSATLPSGILVYIDSNSRRLSLRIPGNLSQSNSETFLAAKVEIGDTQTLAHQVGNTWVLNEIPDYGEELAKCQRFFQMFRTQALRPTYGADCRPVMASETPTAGTITSGSVTYYTLSSEL